MRRRPFVQSLAAGAATAIVPWRRRRADFRAWTWVHGSDRIPADEWRRRFARIRAAGLDAVLVSGSRIETISAAAIAEGMEFHRWMWTLNRPGDAWVKANHPEWFSVSRAGDSSLDKPPYVGYYQWLCPTRPDVREYLRDQVRVLAAATRQAGKPISAAVFPTPTLARKLVRQAWEQWPLDAVFPMLYHRFYLEELAWIGRSTAEGVRALDGREPLYAGLYLPDLSPEELAAAVVLARDAGASGVALFEMNGLSDAHLDALRQTLRP